MGSVTSSSVSPPKPSLTSSTAAEVTSTLSGLTGLTPSNLFANIQSGLNFRSPLDLTRFPGGLPSPSSLLFPYLMNPAASRNFHHHWAQKGLPGLPVPPPCPCSPPRIPGLPVPPCSCSPPKIPGLTESLGVSTSVPTPVSSVLESLGVSSSVPTPVSSVLTNSPLSTIQSGSGSDEEKNLVKSDRDNLF